MFGPATLSFLRAEIVECSTLAVKINTFTPSLVWPSVEHSTVSAPRKARLLHWKLFGCDFCKNISNKEFTTNALFSFYHIIDQEMAQDKKKQDIVK